MKLIHTHNPSKAMQTVVISAIGLTSIVCLSGPERVTAGTIPTYYRKIDRATLTIAADGDRADIYFPQLAPHPRHTDTLPIALMLPGALVDKADYANFATQVARYGFVVVVPNHQRTLTAPNGQPFPGLFAEQAQVNQVLAQMRVEDQNPASPIFKIVDT
jgi:predicted dienelactone hydrolase